MKIQIENLSKEFKEQVALSSVDIEFNSGMIYGIIGRNGSGKTVLMKCIAGLMKPSSGRVMVDEKVVGKDMDFVEDMGIIIETPGFLPMFSGFRNLKMIATIRNKIDDKKICEVIKTVGLDPKSKKHVGKYSMGMKQRLGIAQAIMENPKLIILDEPMNGLDNDGVVEMRELFKDLKERGKLIILCSHNPEDIKILCDHVYEIDKGIINQLY